MTEISINFTCLQVGWPHGLPAPDFSNYVLIKNKNTKRIAIVDKDNKYDKDWKMLKYGSDSKGKLRKKYWNMPRLT